MRRSARYQVHLRKLINLPLGAYPSPNPTIKIGKTKDKLKVKAREAQAGKVRTIVDRILEWRVALSSDLFKIILILPQLPLPITTAQQLVDGRWPTSTITVEANLLRQRLILPLPLLLGLYSRDGVRRLRCKV